MPWQLLALHCREDPVPLPCDGDASIGRRPNNFLVCQDRAVSGTHCILHCIASGAPEFEDCSTNGSFVNELKLLKGQRQQLVDGDVLSLTKPAEDGIASGPRVQYKLVYVERKDPIGAPASCMAGGEVPPTAPDDVIPVEPCFAQDLLVQEQQSKAKVTADLLLSQRKLEDERQAVENLGRELRKTRQQVEEERSKRQEAEDGKAKLGSEIEALRGEAKQLDEITQQHEELRARHTASEKELQQHVGRCEELETQQQRLRQELVNATEAREKSGQQMAELQTRTRQAQERALRLKQQLDELQGEQSRASEEAKRCEEELQVVASGRLQLEEEVATMEARVKEAESSEQRLRSSLDGLLGRRAELECQAAGAQGEAEAAGAAAALARQRLGGGEELRERLREVAKGIGTEVRRRLELWEKVVQQGLPAAQQLLEEALGDVAPTFAQATVREEARVEAPATVAAADLELRQDRADGGCSTAWSLDVMELDPPNKRLRTE